MGISPIALPPSERYIQFQKTMVRFTNTSLLFLVTFLGITGILMLYGSWLPPVFDLHRMAGFSLLALVPWKSIIIYRSLRRGLGKTLDRRAVLAASILLAFLTAMVIGLGLVWLLRLSPYSFFTQTIIAWHWIIGLLLAPLFAFHLWRRWPNPKMRDVLSRRDILKFLAAAGVGIAGGWLAGKAGEWGASQESPRRFTGSRGFGLFTGNDFPIFGEPTQTIDPDGWRLAVTGAVQRPLALTYSAILAMNPHCQAETLDCTSGWYSLQEWGGPMLIDLLEEAEMSAGATGVRLVSATGYSHTYPMEEARTILLATHVTGEVLAPRHGFPLRAVVPGRRGWFWVKWVTEIQVLETAWDVAAGILASPWEVTKQW